MADRLRKQIHLAVIEGELFGLIVVALIRRSRLVTRQAKWIRPSRPVVLIQEVWIFVE